MSTKLIDLTHIISAETPTFDGSCGFHLDTATDYGDCTAPDLFRVQKINCNAGIGTHMDAPVHCFEGASTIDQIPLESLIADCVLIDVSSDASENYLITPDDVNRFEKQYGTISAKSFVIFYTGWDKYWNNPEQFRNELQFPAVHPDTAKLLLERDVAGMGTDTLSADTGKEGFPVHRLILGSGKYLVENIANAGALPPIGARVYILPMKIKNASEAPIRLIAEVAK